MKFLNSADMREAATIPKVKPVSEDGERGNDNYFKQMRHLRDLLEAASTQSSFIGVQATRMSRGDPMTNYPEGSPAWKEAQRKWADLDNEMISLGNDIYKMYRDIQKRA